MGFRRAVVASDPSVTPRCSKGSIMSMTKGPRSNNRKACRYEVRPRRTDRLSGINGFPFRQKTNIRAMTKEQAERFLAAARKTVGLYSGIFYLPPGCGRKRLTRFSGPRWTGSTTPSGLYRVSIGVEVGRVAGNFSRPRPSGAGDRSSCRGA